MTLSGIKIGQFQPLKLLLIATTELDNRGKVAAICGFFSLLTLMYLVQGVKVGPLGGQNERNSTYVRLAHTSIFGLCFMSVCLMKSNCYSLIYSSFVIPFE